MDILSGTPYALDPRTGPRIVESASALVGDIALFHRQGRLSDETLQRLRKEWGFTQVYESAGIEGNELSLNETQMAIQRGITISGKPPEHSDEVRNLHEALQYLEQLASSRTPLSERELREIQQLIVGRTSVGAGGYRTIEVTITNSPH